MKKIQFCMWAFFLYSSLLYSQHTAQQITLEKNYDGFAFTDFVKEIEAAHDVRFYYFTGWVTELKVKQEQAPAQMEQILQATFEGTEYQFYFHTDRQIILTLGQAVRPEIQWVEPAVEQEVLAQQAVASSAAALSEQMEAFETEWIVIGDPAAPEQKPKVTLEGYVYNADTDRPLADAIVYVEELQLGATTDSLGYYEFSLPQGRYRLLYQSVGLKESSQQVQLFASGQIDVRLGELILNFEEVVVRANRKEQIRSVQMGMQALKTETIKELPTLMGEVDVVRSALLLPGVQTVGEFSAGINVRGGGADQNLILLNGAPVYNASHLFGFSSSFSPDIIEGFELYKSSIPAKYGGRISSVLDLQMTEGTMERWMLKGGISPVTSRITLEGPIVKDRSSLIISGRSTYSNYILKRLNRAEFRNSKADYYDVSARYKTSLGQNDHLDVSTYLSNDAFRLNGDTTFRYQNRNAVVNYQRAIGEKMFATFSGIFSQYNFNVNSDANERTAFDLTYRIDHSEARAHFSYAPSDKHQINFGLDAIHYNLDPGHINPQGDASIVLPRQLQREKALEGSVYLSDEWTLSERFSLQAGLRWTNYFFLGPQTVNVYREDAPRTEGNIIDSTYYDGGVVQHYGGPEYRLSMRYSFSANTSIKAAVNRNRQYLSMLFNSASVSPTATWKLSDSHILPQTGDQFSLGLFHNMNDDELEFSLEGYYKIIRNMVEYKAGAELLLNEHLETDIVNGDGRAYGIELLLKKNGRKLNGWLSYTFSKTRFRADSPYPEDRVNDGEWFPTAVDKPHDLSVVAYYKASRRFSFSTNIAYSTGRPVTIPVAKYDFINGVRLQYSRRNEFRVPNYFRWDLSINLEGNHKLKKLAHSSWSLSLYNITGRQNVYSVFFVSDGTEARGYKLSIFGKPFLTLTYNFRI